MQSLGAEQTVPQSQSDPASTSARPSSVSQVPEQATPLSQPSAATTTGPVPQQVVPTPSGPAPETTPSQTPQQLPPTGTDLDSRFPGSSQRPQSTVSDPTSRATALAADQQDIAPRLSSQTAREPTQLPQGSATPPTSMTAPQTVTQPQPQVTPQTAPQSTPPVEPAISSQTAPQGTPRPEQSPAPSSNRPPAQGNETAPQTREQSQSAALAAREYTANIPPPARWRDMFTERPPMLTPPRRIEKAAEHHSVPPLPEGASGAEIGGQTRKEVGAENRNQAAAHLQHTTQVVQDNNEDNFMLTAAQGWKSIEQARVQGNLNRAYAFGTAATIGAGATIGSRYLGSEGESTSIAGMDRRFNQYGGQSMYDPRFVRPNNVQGLGDDNGFPSRMNEMQPDGAPSNANPNYGGLHPHEIENLGRPKEEPYVEIRRTEPANLPAKPQSGRPGGGTTLHTTQRKPKAQAVRAH
jgi:hypothetical protein